MKSTETLQRHQILLFEGDFERLESIYLSRSPTSVIRELVRNHIEAVERKLNEKKLIDANP